MNEQSFPLQDRIVDERRTLLQQLQEWLEIPMLVLAFIWLALIVVEIVWGLNPLVESVGYIIWVIFILDFILEFWLAPEKLDYLKKNWLSGIALIAPALRALRLVRVVRLARLGRIAGMSRGLRLLRVLSSVNRGMRALGATMRRRGFGYVLLLTLIVTFAGAAGMYGFENNPNNNPEGGLHSYGAAVWWTAMIMTTMGSEYWPQTAEGRVLCFFLALYSFAMFGYVTATLATFFVGRDAENPDTEIAGAESISGLRAEIAALREEIQGLRK
ncbi:ion transporter [Nitrosospira multiformis]|uniref:Ion transport protein n=1 Tax=Nitrosospira multiformis (strain ATCC 25196 / NCIMB 11849 / C 71) TaxID=323848 RepID=Q2Y8K5_NITMU|nr:ion transporter [Nitrosospira multiformis]ABB74916.1 Ion transport protein [Nitrosospira multiformis ATCC 25196]SEA58612.1 voltage-gated potassium channel [Nitrosospira multiformis]SEG05094.1 voltage-gated potassium channel [Nitrosospira multiformis ATCC 25196]